MYAAHFGLREGPFSITPDPRYVYMSERHREALAHLLYGVGEGGGFVQLTGEVGTGKTTLCRCLLEQLPREVDVALILNPRMTAAELLATVCDELGIEYPAGTTSLKTLVDTLYRYLLDAHGRGRRTVVIIDEAQDLASDVLEQVRLLTNLETAKEKLLQVILIGQPELIRLLQREDLRQLAQRVTARYHLLPFPEPDTRAYIRHRLEVAGQGETIFTDTATRQVHRLSGGIPRLINVICDRALLGAYALGHNRVGAVTVRRAATEVLGQTRPPLYRRLLPAFAIAAGLVVAVAAAWALLPADHVRRLTGSMRLNDTGAAVPAGNPAATTPASAGLPAGLQSGKPPVENGVAASAPVLAPPPGSPAAARPETKPVKLAEVLADPSLRSDKNAAFVTLYARWGVEYRPAPFGLACDRGRAEGLACLFRTGTWNKLRRFNLPAIIELATPTGAKHYATLVGLEGQTATLDFSGRQVIASLSEIEQFWDGPFILLWKAPSVATPVTQPGTRGKNVEWVRRRLSELDGTPVATRNADLYDEELKKRVMAFQRSRSLVPDGIIGEETLPHLSAAVSAPGTPSLSPARP